MSVFTPEELSAAEAFQYAIKAHGFSHQSNEETWLLARHFRDYAGAFAAELASLRERLEEAEEAILRLWSRAIDHGALEEVPAIARALAKKRRRKRLGPFKTAIAALPAVVRALAGGGT
jgi:chemotaxis protein histidine kinase CheA